MTINKGTLENIWLADFFNRQREIVEAAETPFAKLAVFILPILSPLVPAFMTGIHLYKLLLEMFKFNNASWVAFTMAGVSAIVLELLGYVGAITFISSVFRWIRFKEAGLLIRVVTNGGAYFFYIIAMWAINYQLGKYFQFPTIVNNVFGLLSFITIPTGLLAADHLSQRAEEEKELSDLDEQRKIRAEEREDRLKRFAIKKGMNPWGSIDGKATTTKRPSEFKDQMIEALNTAYDDHKIILKGNELANMFGLDLNSSKGFISGLKKDWKSSRNIL